MEAQMTNRSETRTQFLTDVLITACEGGINFWACVDEYRPSKGFAVICDYVEEEDARQYRVDLDVIARGLNRISKAGQRYCHDESHGAPIRLANRTNGEDGDYDAYDASIVVQVGLFDEVIYG